MSLIKFSARNHPQQMPRDSVDDRGTQPEIFAEFHDRFGFSVDAAAADHNAKLPNYWTSEDDGLAQDWDGERVWCNPPYSDIRPWVEKAHESAGFSVLLLPANRCEQGWWQDLIEPHRHGGRIRVEFLRGRMRFIIADDDGVRPNARPPFGVCLVIFKAAE